MTTTLVGQTVLALAAGVLLNFTPCVLPAIPFKVQAIIKEVGSHMRQRILAALALLLGSLLLFMVLATLAAFLQMTWGSLFQSKVFLATLVALLAVAGVATFLDWSFALPDALYRLRGARYLEPFLTGMLAAVLSTPCTGPFLGGVLAYALTSPPLVTFWLFAAVGIGLALPYVVVIVQPGLLRRLPRGGEWSLRAKQILGFVLLAGAAFFAGSLVPAPWSIGLWYLWMSGVAIWGLAALWKSRTVAARIVPAVCAITGVLLAYSALRPSTAEELSWRPFDSVAMQAAQRRRLPVLIEFTADWCLNCKVLERTVYTDPQVIAAAQTAGVAAFRVDMTEPDLPRERLLLSYGGAGLPFAVLLDPHGAVVERLPDMFTASRLADAIRAVGPME